MNLKTKLLIFTSVLALLGVIVLYVLEFQWFQNYFQLKKLVVGAMLTGLAVGVALGFCFQKRGGELVEKMQIWAVCFILPIVLMPLLASLTNRLFAQPARPVKVQFWEEKAYVQSRFGQLKGDKATPSGFYVFVIMDGEMLRLESDQTVFPTAQQGETVEIPVRKGGLGFAYVAW